jgi:hypothetical protein
MTFMYLRYVRIARYCNTVCRDELLTHYGTNY